MVSEQNGCWPTENWLYHATQQRCCGYCISLFPQWYCQTSTVGSLQTAPRQHLLHCSTRALPKEVPRRFLQTSLRDYDEQDASYIQKDTRWENNFKIPIGCHLWPWEGTCRGSPVPVWCQQGCQKCTRHHYGHQWGEQRATVWEITTTNSVSFIFEVEEAIFHFKLFNLVLATLPGVFKSRRFGKSYIEFIDYSAISVCY